MITAIIIIGIAFAWLGLETRWFTIQLLFGVENPPKYARYVVYNSLKSRKYYDTPILHRGSNYPPNYSPNGEPEYQIILSPGIDNVLCEFTWLDKHCASMVDYKPEVSMNIGNVKYNMTIRQPAVIKDIMKVNKLSRAERKALKAGTF